MKKFVLPMDNRVKPGQATRDEVIANLRAKGIDVQAADPVFDPVTGKLVRVEVNVPDSAAQAARDAIAANPGVAGTTPPVAIPEPLFIFNLENMALTAGSVVASERLGIAMVNSGAPAGTSLGILTNTGYLDLGNNAGFSHAILDVINIFKATPFTLAASDLTLTFDGGTDLVVANQDPITLPGNSSALGRDKFYIDTAGKVYLASSIAQEIEFRTFEEAVAAGAV